MHYCPHTFVISVECGYWSAYALLGLQDHSEINDVCNWSKQDLTYCSPSLDSLLRLIWENFIIIAFGPLQSDTWLCVNYSDNCCALERVDWRGSPDLIDELQAIDGDLS